MARFRTGYMDRALFDLDAVIRLARKDLLPHLDEFDTLVGTGFSGGVVVPALARSLRKKFVLLRKETDDSHHGSGRLLGDLGERWLFVDDFVSSGHTKRRVQEKIAAAAILEDSPTTYVGDYLYAHLGDDVERYRPETTEV
jgi:orotate phosphoribosyltransferase